MAGTVTIYELSKSGNLTPLMRRRIEDRLANKTSEAVQTVPDEVSTAEEATPLGLDEDTLENIEIPEADGTDITIQDASLVTTSAAMTFEPERQEDL
jgi:hypothetical protein